MRLTPIGIAFYCAVFGISVLAYENEQPEDAVLTIEELATKYGHPPEKYNVITEDGYILALYRLPGTRGIPVLLQHGTLESSATWFLRGNSSLAITLANANYDVWLGNLRGNKYSRNHTYLDPDEDVEFWDIDLDHFGIYDLSAIVDTVLHMTRAKKLNAIGHSLGNAIFYILGSKRPHYNNKINLMIALAPVAFLHNSHKPVVWLGKNAKQINDILIRLNIHELSGENSLNQQVLKRICSSPVIGYEICMNRMLFPLTGFDNDEIKPDFYRIILGHYPVGFPRKVMLHYSQIWKRKKFAQFDYGNGNTNIYNTSEPPDYDLSAVTMKIILIAAQNDNLCPLKNVDLLRKRLPRVAQYIVLPRKQFNHLDFTWGEHTNQTLFPFIFDALASYTDLKN